MKVLISRTDRLGDLVLALPLAQSLKKNWPDAQIHFLVRPYQVPLLLHHPDVTDLLVLKDREPLPSFVTRLRAEAFDIALLLFPGPILALALALSRIPVRIGTAYRFYSFFFTERIQHHRRGSNRHEAAHNLDFLVPLGLHPILEPPRLYLTREEKALGEDLVQDKKRPRIVIHPGSGRSARNWKRGYYHALIETLQKENGSLILTGSEEEREEFALEGKEGVQNLMGKTPLRTLMALLARADLLVSGSTGPMHIAGALGIPTVSLFPTGPSSHPGRWGPLHPSARVLTPKEGNTIEDLPLEEVLRAIREMLQASKVSE